MRPTSNAKRGDGTRATGRPAKYAWLAARAYHCPPPWCVVSPVPWDWWCCGYCGQEVAPRGLPVAHRSVLSFDHVVPTLGHAPDNLVVSCMACNALKAGLSLEDFAARLRAQPSSGWFGVPTFLAWVRYLVGRVPDDEALRRTRVRVGLSCGDARGWGAPLAIVPVRKPHRTRCGCSDMPPATAQEGRGAGTAGQSPWSAGA